MISKVLHIKDSYFKIPEKCKDDFGCAIVLLGIYLQRNNLTLDDMNKLYESENVPDCLVDDEQECLMSGCVEYVNE